MATTIKAPLSYQGLGWTKVLNRSTVRASAARFRGPGPHRVGGLSSNVFKLTC